MYRIAVGVETFFAPLIGPSAGAGFALWGGINLRDMPLSFELDLRSTWSVVPAHFPLTYQPLFSARTAYVSGVLAGCWRGTVSLSFCPVLEVGRMTASRADTLGEALRPQIVMAAGFRAVYTWPVEESFFVRAFQEFEVVPQPFTVVDDKGREWGYASPISFTLGAGLGGWL